MTTSAEASGEAIRVEPLADGLVLHWRDGESHFYHYFWLRSACRCELCGDSATGKRQLFPSDVPVDIRPLSCDADASGVNITWPPDQHRSHYDSDWLRDYAYDESPPAWQPKLWDSSLDVDSIAHDFAAVSGGDAARMDFMRTLRDYGVALVRDREARGIEAMAGLIGDIANAAYDPVFELVTGPDQQTLGNSTRFVPPHTDESYLHTPTGMLVLYCVQPASVGGESILVDGFSAAAQLRGQDPDAFDLLSRCPQPNHRVVPGEDRDYRTRARVLTLTETGELAGIRFHVRAMAPIDVPGDLAIALHRANAALSERILDESNQLRYRLTAGEAMIFDNHRVMHARTAFTDPNRHLQICNVAREQFQQNLRLTARGLGLDDEARQYLPAGVCG